MEGFKINLNEMAHTSGRYRRFVLLLASILIILSTLSFFILHSLNNFTEWLFAMLAIYAIGFAYFAYKGNKAQLYLSADDFAVEYQFGYFAKTPISIMWQTIKKVRLGPTYIAFFKKSGRGKRLHIGWLPYTKVIEVKDKIKAFAEAKNIEVEMADFSKG